MDLKTNDMPQLPEPTRPPSGLRSRAVQLILVGVALAGFVGGYIARDWMVPNPPEASALGADTRPAAADTSAPQIQPTLMQFVDDDPAFGPEDAPITIVEFSDFECPFCKKFHDETFRALIAAYEGQIRFVYRDLPLTGIHPRAQIAAEVGECAHEQDRFWPMHDLLFSQQDVWKQAGNPIDHFVQYATDLRLDIERFKDCLRTGRTTEEIEADLQAGMSYGIQGTPSFVINGKLLRGAVPFEIFKNVLDRELAASEGGR